LTTNNKVISNLLLQASKLLTECNIQVTNDVTVVGSFLQAALYKIWNRSLCVDLCNIEAGIISTFIDSVSPNQQFILCDDTYLNEVLCFVSAELAILTDVIPDFHARFSFSEQSKLLLNTCKFPKKMFVKFVKYHIACPMASVLDQVLPVKPIGYPGHYLIWTGSIKRFLKNILNRRNFNSDSTPLCLMLSLGFLQGIKRGCAIVSDSFKKDEVLAHVKAMTTAPTYAWFSESIDRYTGLPLSEVTMSRDGSLMMDPSSYSEVKVSHDPIKETFGSTCNAILRNTNKSYTPAAYEPSHNSCYELCRRLGGAYMQIVEELELPLVESEEILIKGKIVKNFSFQLPNIEAVIEKCRARFLEKSENLKLMEEFSCFKDEIPDYESYLDIRPLTTVIPLCEPLKVRVITKGEALPSYAAKSLQKSMKSYINRFPSLVLTTRPLLVEDFRKVWGFEKLIEEKFGISLGFTDHVSGDYKAATDKLNIGFTKLIFEQFMSALNVPEQDRPVYRNVLYEQSLVYPTSYSKFLKNSDVAHLDTNKDGKSFVVDQKNGQLMGSILSFPILCIANLICYKCAIDEYINLNRKNGEPKRYVNVFDLPCLVNGDDIYFRSNPIFYQIWLKFINIAGFILSVGKNYVHKSVFTINSQCFSYNKTTDTIREITYLNVGLLIGQSKSGILGEKLPTWDLYNKVLRGCYNKTYTHNRFLYYHSDSIAQITKNGNYNLFLPKVLGGLGFERSSPDIPVRITAFQRQLATYFHNKVTSAYLTPTVGLKLSQATLIDENSPIAYDPYLGESVQQFIKKGETMPEGFNLPQLLPKPGHLMIHQLEHMTPKLAFRSITSSILRDFRQAKSSVYHGSECWFGFDASVSGNYPYVLVRRELDDVETYEENLHEVTVKKVKLIFKDVLGEMIKLGNIYENILIAPQVDRSEVQTIYL